MPVPRSWRPVLLRLHRWIAFSAGLVLLLNACTGLLMLGGEPLDELLNHHLYKVQPQARRLPLEQLRQTLRAELPTQNLTLHPGQAPDDAIDVVVRGDGGWEGKLFVDPYSGNILGRRERFGLNLEGLFELHSSLLWGKTGKAILGGVALAMLFMLVTGLLMWWPVRWRMAFSMQLRGPRLRTLFDLHRVGGAVLGLWVIVCVGSGGLLAYRPALQWINQLAGSPPMEAPKLPAAAKTSDGAAAAPATLDDMQAAAMAAMPGSSTGTIVLPPSAKQPIRIRQKTQDDPHPYGLSSVWLHPQTGAVLRVDPWRMLAPGERSIAWIYPLHSGKLAGAIGTVITTVGGLTLLGFGITGTWLWWLRRPRKAARGALPQARQTSS